MKILSRSLILITAILFNAQLYAQTENISVISADKMNVFYIGMDNPVTIAVPGITSDKLKVSINNGSIKGNDGKYVVRVDKVMETIIEVSAEIKPGEEKKVGSNTFRVKRIPNPQACIGNNCSNNIMISKEDLLKSGGITIQLNMPFDLDYEVISFVLSYIVDRGTEKDLVELSGKGNKFDQNMIDAINKIENGGKIYIEDIKAKGPDGSVRTLSAIKVLISE
ncbi:MAG TPA: GldM family protein [Bacteroidales bacterium]|nr:GldM family protein [Bacteroidales bacterium]